jgi:SprT protein
MALKFLNDGISMDNRLKMIALFERYAGLFENVSVDWNYKMRSCAGRAWISKGFIQLNARLLTDNPNEFMPTFAHELAHLVARKRYGNTISAHGRQWASVMREMGHEPERTHNLDVSKIKRRWARVGVNCACKTHMVTKHRYSRIMDGAKFRCLLCKTYLGEG